ncbi:MAG: M23 family metallopeptidase [Patescibacteria group bacterium]
MRMELSQSVNYKIENTENTTQEGSSPSFFNSKKSDDDDEYNKTKKAVIFFILSLFSFLRLLKKIAIFLMRLFRKIIFIIFLNIHKCIKIVILNIYKIYLFFKKQIQKFFPSDQKIFYLLSHYSIFYIIFAIIIFLVISDNLKAREINVSIFGQKTIFYHLLNKYQNEFIEDANLSYSEQPDETLFLDANIDHTIEQENEGIIMTQGGTILVKPNISVTIETPQIRTKPIQYIVKAGDVVSGIAKKFGISVNTILWENNLRERSLIKPGDALTILPTTGVIHTVTKGESLEKIAKKYEVSAEEILKTNELVNINLKINQKIFIPGGEKYFPAISPKRIFAKNNWMSSSKKQILKGGSKRQFIWPTSGHNISQYSHWGHTAIDITGKNYSSPIYASADGVIKTVIYSNRGYGRHVIIGHSNGISTLYGHMSKIFVNSGEKVEKGQVIGLLGNTGRSTGPHIHFEIRINGKKINPLIYIR